MKKQSTYQIHKVSFKRWKRTSWAVFTSLKVVVHNCCTKISSFKDSLLKQQGTNKSELVSSSAESGAVELVSLSAESGAILELENIGLLRQEEFLLEGSLLQAVSVEVLTEVHVILLPNYYTSLSITPRVSVGIFYAPIA